MEKRIILSRFTTRNLLSLTPSEDAKCVTVSGGNINKTYEAGPEIVYHLEKISTGYLLSIDVPDKFTKRVVRLLDDCYDQSSYYFRTKALEALIGSQIVCTDAQELARNMTAVEEYLEGREFGTYPRGTYSSACGEVVYPPAPDVVARRMDLHGGILVDGGSLWRATCAGLCRGGEGETQRTLIVNATDIPDDDCRDYHRVVLDCSDVQSLDRLAEILEVNTGRFKCRNRWVVIQDLPMVPDLLLHLVDFVAGRRIIYPVVSDRTPVTPCGMILRVVTESRAHKDVRIVRRKICFDRCERSLLDAVPKVCDILDEVVAGQAEPAGPAGPAEPARPMGECPICTETLDKEFMCRTTCGHDFCITCIVTSLRDKRQCPMCRSPVEWPGLRLCRTGLPGKIVSILENLPEGRVLVYMKSLPLLKRLHTVLPGYLVTGSKATKLKQIDQYNNDPDARVILLQSRDYPLARHATGIRCVITSDYDYRYVTNRGTLGADFVNDVADVGLIILEY